jgi:hypothetical protein
MTALNLVELIRSSVFTRLRTRASESDDPSVEDVAAWIGEQLQEVEDAINDIRTLVPLVAATGAQLDAHGAAISEARNGLSDDDYRETLIALYGALSQKRTPFLVQQLLSVLTTGDDTTFVYREYYPAAFDVELSDVTATRAAHIERILRRTKLEGVRFTETVIEDSTTSFRFDTPGRGFDNPGVGFAYTLES